MDRSELESRWLVIEGARQNNLKNVCVKIPHGKLTVITGISGAGKSSLAVDTIFAEAHTRYVESLSNYTKLFLERISKPAVEIVKNIPPAILLEQHNPVRTSRSTVGTVTEIYDYLRVLFAKIGVIYCPVCGIRIKGTNPVLLANELINRWKRKKVYIGYYHEWNKGERVIGELLKEGFVKIYIKGKVYHLEEDIDKIPGNMKECIVIVDVVRLDKKSSSRLIEALETGFRYGGGCVVVVCDGKKYRYHAELVCNKCGRKFERPKLSLFNFNYALSACPVCKGFGNLLEYDEYRVIPNQDLTLREGAIDPWNKPNYRWWYDYLMEEASYLGIDVNCPYRQLSSEQKRLLWDGNGSFEGIRGFFKFLEKKRYKLHIRVFLARYKGQVVCPECKGSRLRKEALCIKIKGKDITQITSLPVNRARNFFRNIKLSLSEENIVRDLLSCIQRKLECLDNVGLGYLTLDRQTRTLSGGEAQRVNLAQQLGQGLVGTLYILDEPTIGLHPKDISRLVRIIKKLANIGNTVVLIEHDREVIKWADYIIELGPGAGRFGGEVVFQGDRERFAHSNTLTSNYIKRFTTVPIISKRRKPRGYLRLKGACIHNLKDIDVDIPLGVFVAVTGVSGSGKSSLIVDTLYQVLAKHFNKPFKSPILLCDIEGMEQLKGVVMVDQEPISKNPRSNPATYMKVFDFIRKVMGNTSDAKRLGLGPAHFSFNTSAGKCPACQGSGVLKIEMYFLADVYSICEECGGKRFRKEVLEVKYKGKNIDDILNMTVEEAYKFFKGMNSSFDKCMELLDRMGLGYLKLGQPLSTLSGGETQRLKIAQKLAVSRMEKFMIIMDEPTTGLHLADITKLVDVMNMIVEEGNTVVVIEHNLDLVKNADYVIDLGPEGGEEGGRIVAIGTPEEVVKCKDSYTGRFLKKYVGSGERRLEGRA